MSENNLVFIYTEYLECIHTIICDSATSSILLLASRTPRGYEVFPLANLYALLLTYFFFFIFSITDEIIVSRLYLFIFF